ncbi:MAG: 1-acyl-sn-glycerol-3-phosphate acyltransferase [Bacteroidales bacterium]|nr:1-acyl-sn-glycerol-3-phosphate acyltransferase [Bacteroidales bacterium]
MQTIKITDFYDEFRPYNEKEALEAVKRISANKRFKQLIHYFFPDLNDAGYIQLMNSVQSINDFQMKIMHQITDKVIENTITELSVSGLKNIEKDKHYVFISNHRDIVLDATLFEYILADNGFRTTEITFGNNLMEDPLVFDIGKTNKMFKVYRKGTPKELLKKTLQLSEYIRYTVFNKKESVWIAQRGGRTKNGDDKTHSGILKMLNASGTGSFEENIRELMIVPLSVSYEFEPNDHLKVKELLHNGNTKYVKSEGEDIKSIIDGTCSNKGNVHIAIGKPINSKLPVLETVSRTNNKVKKLGEIIDSEIYRNYYLFPNNYIAYDLLNHSVKFQDFYSEGKKEIFLKYKEEQLNKINNHSKDAEILFLNIYANPVINIQNL